MGNIIRHNFRMSPPPNLFKVGDTFTSGDGVRVHVVEERMTENGRQFLYCAHGTKMWAADDKFRRI